VVEQKTEAADIDPALEGDVEDVQRVLAHLQGHQLCRHRLALGAELAQQPAIDEPLMGFVGADLRLGEAVFRRRALVDPGPMLLDGSEFGRSQRVDDLEQGLAVLLGHLLDGLDFVHALHLAVHHPARYTRGHGRDLPIC